MKDATKGSRGSIWVGVLNSRNTSELEKLLKIFQKEAQNYDNAAVIVGSELSFEECARLEDTFDFVVKLGNDKPEQLNLLLWDDVMLRMPTKKNGIIPHHLTNGHAHHHIEPIPKQLAVPEPIAVIGLSCRLPGANDATQFWDNLIQGVDSLRVPPPGRWRSDQGCTVTPEHYKTQAGFLSCPVDTFDPTFWGMSPLELGYTDPQARMLLQLGWEALENAGIPPSSLYGSNSGIFLGLWRDEYKDLLLQSGSRGGGEELRRYLGCSMGNAAARLAHALKTTGPALATETGCSSSICSIGAAMSALRAGKTNLALAGGSNLLLKPFIYPDFQGVLSPSGRCRVFQEDANGFARAEGAIFFVLKRLSDATKDGDFIHALLRGYGASQEGLTKSAGTPTVQGESLSMTLALNDAGIPPSAIDWVEMHGTGTKVGDPIEIASTRLAYCLDEDTSLQTDLQTIRNRPLILSSVKANIGHTESVSGAAGLLKVILALEHSTIPKQLLTAPFNPKLNLDGITIPKEAIQWGGRMAGVSSFGITGTNAHLIVERAENLKIHTNTSNQLSAFILPMSAKCPGALKDLKLRHAEALQNLDDSEFANYCYTAALARDHFTQFRSAAVASNREEMIESLLNDGTFEPELHNLGDNSPPSLCFLFPGQGCQYTGMGRGLYESCSIFRRHFDIVDNLLGTKYGINLKSLLFQGTAVSLYSQLCIFGVEYSLLKMWSGWGLVPSAVLGHSFGEFAASVAAGAISLPTALELLVAMRTKLFSRVEAGGMLVLKGDEAMTKGLIEKFLARPETENDDWVDIAGLNSAEQTVVSARPGTILAFSKYCKEVGVKNTGVGVTHAFHSRALEPIGKQFEEEAGTLSYSPRFPGISYISSVEGRLMEGDEVMGASYWRRHMRQRVEFIKAAKAAVVQMTRKDGGGKIFLEVGPHPLLSPLVSQNAPPDSGELLCIPSMRKSGAGGPQSELGTVLEAIANLYVNGVNLDWNRVWGSLGGGGSFTKIPRIVPGYQFQNDEVFWFTPESDSNEDQNNQMLTNTGPLVHPLLGSKLSTPLPSTHIFVTSTQGLLQRGGEWLRDHKLGSHVIFPGAGYVEMATAAVVALRPAGKKMGVQLTKFEIKAALPLQVPSEIQTVVEEEQSGFKVGFYSRKEDSMPWRLLATTRVTLLTKQEDEIIDSPELGQEEGMEGMINLYQDMAKLGYNFGPTFRTLEKLHKCKDGSLLSELVPSSELGYYLHPTIIDALVQAALLAENQPLSTLKLPTSIGSLQIRTHSPTLQKQRLFISATRSGSSLLSYHEDTGNWSELASLSTLTTVSTSLKTFERAAGLVEEPKLLPHWVEEWTTTEELLSNTTEELSPMDLSTLITNNVPPFALSPEAANELIGVESYICQGVVATLHQLGWECGEGSVVTEEEIRTKLNIADGVAPPFLRRLLHYAQEAGFLIQVVGGGWKVLRQFSSANSNGNLTESNDDVNPSSCQLQTEWSFASFYVSKLGRLLRGEESVLPYLFPAPNSSNQDFSAERLYSNFSQNTGLLANLAGVFSVLTRAYAGRELRILEVGAGTGSATRKLLHLLEGKKTRYTFSDLSPAFLTLAEGSMPKIPGVEMDYRVLNLEKDPLTQEDFKAGSYDAIVALNVLHATVDVTQVCSNLRSLLRPGGHLLIAEQLRPTALVDIVFGHCEGYWRFQDEIRTNHCLLPEEGWTEVLNQAGYGSTLCVESKDIGMGVMVATNDISSSKTSTPSNWVIVAEKENSSFSEKLTQSLAQEGTEGHCLDYKCDLAQQNIHFVEGHQFIFCIPDDNDQPQDQLNNNAEDTGRFRPILASFLQLSQFLIKRNLKNVKLLVVSRGVAPIKDEEAVFPLAHPILGLSRTLANECSGIEVKWVDLDPEHEEDGLGQVLAELSNPGERKSERFISYRNGQRHVGKLVRIREPTNTLLVPEGRVQLRLPESRSIADVEWEKASEPEKKPLGPNEIEVRVLASGLNFKDLLNIMKPTREFEHAIGVGADFCGEIIRLGSDAVSKHTLGDSVIGMNPYPAPLPNHVTVDASLVAKLPPNLTHTDGATLPTAFLTAYHCLIDVGQLKSGEWALIHTASGAVGLAAIQVATSIGAKVIATAGSKRKRAYLRSLGLVHVFKSRDLSFGPAVLEATSGSGVHLVLNSLTSKGWKEASLAVTAKGGRFVEMSKLNIWSVQQVRELRPDVSYSVEDLSKPDLIRAGHLTERLEVWLRDGRLKPLRHSVFCPEQIPQALGQLERALHIGKVVITWSPALFNERSSYLITGGLGALGIEVAKWMLSSGAKHVILVSRGGSKSAAVLDKLNDGGALDTSGLVVINADIGDKEQVVKLLTQISSSQPPLRGIFHCAGVLSDGTLPSQSMTKMESVLHGKVDGAWALHSATQSASLSLDHFVLFSSAMWILGGPGQGNYAAANASLSSLAEHRHRLGLPASSIAWGHWGEVGMAAETGRRIFGVEPFSTERGLASLEHLLRSGSSWPNIMAAELSEDVRHGWLSDYVDKKEDEVLAGESTIQKLAGEAESNASVEERVRAVVGRILRVRGVLDGRKELRALGMDSLMFIELKNRLQAGLGVVLEIPDTATVDELVAMVEKEKGLQK